MDFETRADGDFDGAHLQPTSAEPLPAANPARTQVLTPNAQGVVVLPQGVSLDDVEVVGRNLVVVAADGTRYVIVDGAVIVPQIVVDGVAVPPLNLAALLLGNEPEPAAGNARSSGGNFAVPVGPIQAAYGLGDLLPYTELSFPEPQDEEIIPQPLDRDPTTIIISSNNPTGAQAATATVNEAGLPARPGEPAGSDSASNSETTVGSIQFEALDGLRSITLNGVAITTVGQTFTTPRGVLTITSMAPGSYGYSYTLTDNTNANANPMDVFVVAVTDTDGDVATANLTISVADDVPTARNDTDTVAAGSYAAETGNVVTGTGTTSGATGADTKGADDATVTGFRAGTAGNFAAPGTTVNGTYGKLIFDAGGNYTYTRNAGTPGGVTDTFSYQLTDGDSDTSTATLIITIADSPAVVTSVPTSGAATTVNESGLPTRPSESEGSASAAPSESASGTITFAAPDGVASVAINGTVITGVGQVITTPTGTFTVTGYNPGAGTLTYTFTLTDNTAGDTTTQVINVTVTDTDGDSDTKPFTITIVDDVPTARNDSATQPTENAAVTVNVMANDTPGADSVSLTSGVAVVPGTLSGAGTLAYNNNGSFIYTPGKGEEGTVTFQYRITDGDGDSSTATVTITLLRDSTPSVRVEGDTTVDEAALPARPGEAAGSNAASNEETATGTINITTGGDTLAKLVVGGVDVTSGGTVTGASGTLTVTLVGGVYNYSYTLTDNTSGDATQDSFSVQVTDSDNDVASTTLVIAIIDDVPTARADTDSVTEGASTTGNVLDGTGTTNLADSGDDTSGADSYAAGGGVVGVRAAGLPSNTTTAVQIGVGTQITGLYGTLTLQANGDYTYKSDPNKITANQEDTFVYTIKDGDGDLSTTTLVITVNNVTLRADNQDQDVFEAALDPTADDRAGTLNDDLAGANTTGSNPGAATETVSGQLAVAGATTYTLVGGGSTVAGTYGQFKINSDGSYTYTLTKAVDGDSLVPSQGGNNGTNEYNNIETFSYVATDANGNTVQGSVTIDVTDDIPNAIASGSAPAFVLDESAAGTDTPGGAPAPTGLASVSASFAGNFAGSIYGADGAGSLAYALTLSADGIGSGFFALQPSDTTTADLDGIGQGAEILLYKVGNDIVGRLSPAGTTYFTISVDNNSASANFGKVTFTQALNSWHDDKANADDSETLTLDGQGEYLRLTQTVTDGDGDIDSDFVNLGASVFTIQDDGPRLSTTVGSADTLVLDESAATTDRGPTFTTPSGRATTTADFSDNFTAANFGTDGALGGSAAAGGVRYALVLTGTNVASGLYALDAADTTAGDGDPVGRGIQIVLNQDAITGVITGSVGVTPYFTISVDVATGVVTFTQARNIWHDDPANADDPETVTLASADALKIVQTVTDADGDSTSAGINLGTGVFTIEDDGPDAVVSNAVADTLVLDESRPVGTDTPSGAPLPAGVASVSASFADNFDSNTALAGTQVDYGSDGAGSVAYALSISAAGIGSGLYALDASDTSTTDGDGIGQGDEILLYKVGNDIVGRTSLGGATYFTIAVDNVATSATFGTVTFSQALNVWHDTPGNPDDPETLTLNGAGEYLRLTQTVTDADGDADSASIELGTGVFTIQDDGPTVFIPDEIFILNAKGTPPVAQTETVALNFAGKAGTDGVGSAVWNIINGSPALDTNGNPLKSGGNPIYLFGDGGFRLVGSTDPAFNIATYNPASPPASVVFVSEISASSDTITTTVLAPVGNGVGFSETDIVGAVGGGNNDSLTIGLGNNNNAVDIIVDTPTPGGTVNTSNGRIGLSGGNSISNGEAVTIDFAVNVDGSNDPGDINLGNADPELAGLYATAWFGTKSFQQEVNRINGNNTTADILVDTRLNGVPGPDITHVVIFDATGTPVLDRTTSGAGGSGTSVTFNANGSVNIIGLQQGWDYFVQSNSDFTGVFVTGAFQPGGNDQPFTLGAFTLGGEPFQPFTLVLPVEATDRDGDVVASQTSLTFVPNTADNIVADPAGTTINGNANANVLVGLGGDDIISGGDKDDRLSGGGGQDSLTGGLGADRFMVAPADLLGANDDNVTDYSAAQNDVVDLTAVFTYLGANGPTTGAQTAAAVKLFGNTLYVDADGTGAGTVFVPVLTFTTPPTSVLVLYSNTQAAVSISPSPAAPPIVLDLDGDGLEFQSLSAGVSHDYDLDGNATPTAWVGRDDGLLALRQADGSIKINFATDAGETDLAGLAKVHDSNGDGALDANDATFASFGVWQDADGDGVLDEGEFSSLEALGISSIGLKSDGNNYLAASGDVLVSGQGSFVRNGVTSTLADAAFVTDRRAAETAMVTAAAGALLMPEAAAASGDKGTADLPLERAVAGADAAPSTLIDASGATNAGDVVSLLEEDTAQTDAVAAHANSGEVSAVAPMAEAEAGSEVTDSGGSEAVADFGIDAPVMFGAGNGEAALDALLIVNAAPALHTQDLAPVREALADLADEQAVDAIVDHFAGGADAMPANDIGSAVLLDALDSSVFAGLAATAGPDAIDDAAQLLAAAQG